jgi:hypothetical protein
MEKFIKGFEGGNVAQQSVACALIAAAGWALYGAIIGLSNMAVASNKENTINTVEIKEDTINTVEIKITINNQEPPYGISTLPVLEYPEVITITADIAEPLEKAIETKPYDGGTDLPAVIKDIGNITDDLTAAELAATGYAGLKQWKESVKCYRWLFQQKMTGSRMAGVLKSFQYVSDLWEFDKGGDFLYDVSQGLVAGFINSGHVNFRQEPSTDSCVIRQFKLHEEVTVLRRSDFKENIKSANTFWYEICTSDGSVGYVYGQYLCFYPSTP